MTTYNHYFPIMYNLQRSGKIGAQIEGHVLDHEKWLVPGQAFQYPVSWARWTNQRDGYIADAKALENYHVTIGCRHVPENDRLWQAYISSPPHPDSLERLAQHLCRVIDLLQPNALELFNEPNIGVEEASQFQEYFGAWINDRNGKNPDAYEGGLLYRDMLEAVYPIVKAHAPNVQIIAGALMKNRYMDDFLRAFKRGPADAISFHHYLQIGDDFNDLRDMIDRISAITDLPLILSETSVLATLNSDRLEARQAEYFQWIMDNFSSLHPLIAVKWYTLSANGWMESDLVRQEVPRPAYFVFRGSEV